MAWKKRKMGKTLYIGYDGSYVMSWHKMYKMKDGEGNYYLGTKTKKRPSMVDVGLEGKCVFGAFKLKEWQVIAIKL